jgi:hypothetical protein
MTRRQRQLLFIVGLLCLAGGLFLANGAQPSMAQEDEEPNPIGEPPVFLAGYYDAWVNSPHARFEDEAFTHWDEDEEQVVPESCAKCHSTPGYQDFLGADGSEAGVVDAPAPLGTVINCDACHNPAASSLTSVAFPSGAEISDIGDASRCMVCHQGRASGASVAGAIEEAGLMEEPNTVSEDLRFINIHYYAAASTLYGSEVGGGYEFEGEVYYPRNTHAEGYDTCISCHSPHTLELKVNDCASCHEGVETVEDVQAIRSVASSVDYDGDGDLEEGIRGEIETLQEMLYSAIQMYAADVVGTPIVYDEHAYPYLFVDTNANGEIDEDEANYGNAYNAFTPVMVEVTYNYQMSKKDPGAYAHNPDYVIQLLYDSIAVINEQLGEGGVDLSAASRDSFGHFEYTAEAFRHWDEDGEVSASCSRCHTADGLPFFLEHGVTIAMEPAATQTCATCHNNLGEFTLYPVAEVEMPSGATVSFGEESANNICLACHQGRQSGSGVQALINGAGVGDDEVSESLRVQNPHYFAGGATLFGSDAGGAYEFADMDYNGQYGHTRQYDECSDCHDQHSAAIRFDGCTECHENVEAAEDVMLIRAHPDDKDPVDYDGDGDDEEPIRDEIETLHSDLFAQIETYAADTAGSPILYVGSSYPYFFNDLNGNGEADEGEVDRANSYASWTPTLLRSVYNYLWVAKDPGSFAHNPDYILQVLYDSLADIGGEEAVANYTRPEVREDD